MASVGLVVKELKTLNALMQNFEVDRMKIRLKDLGLLEKSGIMILDSRVYTVRKAAPTRFTIP